MKRRDPRAERRRWRRLWGRRSVLGELGHSLAGSIVSAALGFGMLLAIGVTLHSPVATFAARWPAPMEQSR